MATASPPWAEFSPASTAQLPPVELCRVALPDVCLQDCKSVWFLLPESKASVSFFSGHNFPVRFKLVCDPEFCIKIAHLLAVSRVVHKAGRLQRAAFQWLVTQSGRASVSPGGRAQRGGATGRKWWGCVIEMVLHSLPDGACSMLHGSGPRVGTCFPIRVARAPETSGGQTGAAQGSQSGPRWGSATE